MDEFDRQLKQTLSGEERFDAGRSDAMRKEVLRMYDEKLKRVKWLTWGSLILDAIVIIVLVNLYGVMSDVKALIAIAVLALAAYESTILMKLWYWTMNVKMSTLKEMKELQLQIAELSQRIPPAQNASETTPSGC